MRISDWSSDVCSSDLAMRLGVNVDHVATLRQARGTVYPDPVEAGRIALAAGATSITVHLREDRRHIQDRDVAALVASDRARINLEIDRKSTRLNSSH